MIVLVVHYLLDLGLVEGSIILVVEVSQKLPYSLNLKLLVSTGG